MSIRRTKYNWDYRTLCDFGTHGRKQTISRHYSLQAAQRAFKQLKKYYSRESFDGNKILWRCWQENRAGDIINDTGVMVYA